MTNRVRVLTVSRSISATRSNAECLDLLVSTDNQLLAERLTEVSCGTLAPASPSDGKKQADQLNVQRLFILLGPAALSRELVDMNRFLVAKSEPIDEFRTVSWHSISKAAHDLRNFAQWLNDHWNSVDLDRHYLNFSAPLRKARPTYAYLDYLKELPGLAASSKNNRIAIVRSFYEFLERTHRLPGACQGRYQLTSSSRLNFESSSGARLTKSVRTSDLKIPNGSASATPTLSGHVLDGCAVRPLSAPELRLARRVLADVSNPVFRICSFLALNCGARLQTLLTIRRSDAQQITKHLRVTRTAFHLKIGGDSLVMAKGGRPNVLYVPCDADEMIVPYDDVSGAQRSIAEIISAYESSEQANDRFELANRWRRDNSAQLQDPLSEYLFLGRNGRPYYLDNVDPLNLLRRSPRVGGSFKSSFEKTVNPAIRREAKAAGLDDLARHGVGIHDLRGTFAEQSLVRSISALVRSGVSRVRAEELAVRRVQRLLGHAQVETTYRYLVFRQERDGLIKVNDDYSSSIFGDSDDE